MVCSVLRNINLKTEFKNLRLKVVQCSAMCAFVRRATVILWLEQKQIRHVLGVIFKCLTNYFSARTCHNITFRHFSLMSNCHGLSLLSLVCNHQLVDKLTTLQIPAACLGQDDTSHYNPVKLAII